MYVALGGLLLLALFGLACLHAIQKREHLAPEATHESKVLLT
jgi:hypothetical protein